MRLEDFGLRAGSLGKDQAQTPAGPSSGEPASTAGDDSTTTTVEDL